MYRLINIKTGKYYAGVWKDEISWTDNKDEAIYAEERTHLVGVEITLRAVFDLPPHSLEIVDGRV